MYRNGLKYIIMKTLNNIKTIPLVFLILWSLPSPALICHPKVNHHLPQYLVGYGSLIDEQSKRRTDPAAKKSFPTLIKGYKRSWSVQGSLPGFNASFLSAIEDQSSSFNAVIYQLSNPECVEQYDKREVTYCRKELNGDTLTIYATTLPAQKQIWIYTPRQNSNQPPTHDYPIVQSYVDIFIRGCFQMEEKFKIKNFAKNCVKSTNQWSEHWVNDRIFPRRPSQFEPYASKIDALLKETLPEQFKSIRIE